MRRGNGKAAKLIDKALGLESDNIDDFYQEVFEKIIDQLEI